MVGELSGRAPIPVAENTSGDSPPFSWYPQISKTLADTIQVKKGETSLGLS